MTLGCIVAVLILYLTGEFMSLNKAGMETSLLKCLQLCVQVSQFLVLSFSSAVKMSFDFFSLTHTHKNLIIHQFTVGSSHHLNIHIPSLQLGNTFISAVITIAAIRCRCAEYLRRLDECKWSPFLPFRNEELRLQLQHNISQHATGQTPVKLNKQLCSRAALLFRCFSVC